VILTAALFSAAAWADGIDPKVIIQKGGGSIPITVTNPNPSFPPVMATQNANCLTKTDACVFEVFQNQTPITLASVTIAIDDIQGFSFLCGSAAQILYFSSCNATDNGSITNVVFSGGSGIAPAVQQCVPDSPGDQLLAFFGKFNCRQSDPDDYKFVGGEFGVLIDATKDEGFNGQSVIARTVTTPEPGVGILLLFGALAFGLLKPVRRAA
jgi:hypothetical protein